MTAYWNNVRIARKRPRMRIMRVVDVLRRDDDDRVV